MNRLCRCHPAASSSYLTGVLRRNRHQGSSGWRRAATAGPHFPGKPAMQMKPFHAAAVILAIAGFGVGQSAAQTSATVPGSIGATSPLGAGFSDPAGSSQSAAVPYSGGANPAPCSAGSPVMPALPIFDGVGMNQATSSLVGAMPGAVASVPCNSVSTSGVMSSSNNSGTTATSSSSSSSSSPPTTATANSTSNAAGVGVAGLGMNGLGTTSLGTTGLGAVGLGTIQPGSVTGSASQPSISSTVANGFQSPCAAPGGPAPNLPQSGSVAIPDPAQTLGGSASVPSMPCPNPGPATGTSAGSSMISE
jgi:hypothetical protein